MSPLFPALRFSVRFGAVEQAGVVFAPFHALDAAEVLRRALHRMEGGLDDAVGAGDVDRAVRIGHAQGLLGRAGVTRSEEHTSELQSLMRITYAVYCLKKKKSQHHEQKQAQA